MTTESPAPAPAPTDPNPTPPPAPTPPPPPTKTFTQEEVNALATREKEEGRRAAERAIAEKLGVSVEDAAKLIAEQKQRDEAAMTEAEKREKAAAEREAQAQAREDAANLAELNARKRVALLGANAPSDPKKLDRLVTLVDVEPGADDAAVEAAVKLLKTEVPELFGPAKPAAPSSDPGGAPSTTPPSEDAFSKGAEMAKKYAEQGKVTFP